MPIQPGTSFGTHIAMSASTVLQPSHSGNCFSDDQLLVTLSKLSTVSSCTVAPTSVSCPVDFSFSDLPEPSDLCEQNALMYFAVIC